MFPDSPYAHPVGSFQRPVPVPGVDPDSGQQIAVIFSAAWLPYVVGALKQLVLQSTWIAEGGALDTVQGQAMTLLYLFSIAQSVPSTQYVSLGADMPFFREVCEGGQSFLEFESCPGEWTRLANSNQIGQPGQQSGGAPQPPAGGSQCYNLSFAANSLALVPTTVNSGDQVTLNSASGAGSDDGLHWYCDDGSIFFAGTCSEPGITFGTDPLPSAPHMALLLEIGTTLFQAVVGTPITVPPGVTNAQIALRTNDPNLTLNSGSYAVSVCVQNNATPEWTHTFDFSLESGGFIPQVAGASGAQGAWQPGLYWGSTDTVASDGSNERGMLLHLSFPARDILSISVQYDLTLGAIVAGDQVLAVVLNPGAVIEISKDTASVVQGTGVNASGSIPVSGGNQIVIQFNSDYEVGGVRSGVAHLLKLTISGKGTDPF